MVFCFKLILFSCYHTLWIAHIFYYNCRNSVTVSLKWTISMKIWPNGTLWSHPQSFRDPTSTFWNLNNLSKNRKNKILKAQSHSLLWIEKVKMQAWKIFFNKLQSCHSQIQNNNNFSHPCFSFWINSTSKMTSSTII